jgi:hypothetical protein
VLTQLTTMVGCQSRSTHIPDFCNFILPDS